MHLDLIKIRYYFTRFRVCGKAKNKGQFEMDVSFFLIFLYISNVNVKFESNEQERTECESEWDMMYTVWLKTGI